MVADVAHFKLCPWRYENMARPIKDLGSQHSVSFPINEIQLHRFRFTKFSYPIFS